MNVFFSGMNFGRIKIHPRKKWFPRRWRGTAEGRCTSSVRTLWKAKAQADGGSSYGILRAAIPPAAPRHSLLERFQLIILQVPFKIGSDKLIT